MSHGNGLTGVKEGEGDLTMRLPVTSQDEIGTLATWFNTFIDKLQEIIRQIGENAASVSGSATEPTTIAAQMSTGTDNTVARATNDNPLDPTNPALASFDADGEVWNYGMTLSYHFYKFLPGRSGNTRSCPRNLPSNFRALP